MPDSRRARRIREQVAGLQGERSAVEAALLRHRRMLAASLIARHLGTAEAKRASVAFYLSWARAGRTQLVHVPKGRLGRVRGLTEAWREYRAALRRWRELAARLDALWAELGEAQAGCPEGFHP
jgi:hypothetical protein